MRTIKPSSFFAVVSATVLSCCAMSAAYGQSDAIDNELKRINGHWRVIELTENGNSIPENQMRELLPGGGVMEIVDYIIIFKSPLDGSKSTKTYRIDPTSYPKQIAIMERDNTTGTGIYEFSEGKLVVCVSNASAEVPTEFSAAADSGRTLIVLSRFDPGTSETPGINSTLPEQKVRRQAVPPAAQPTPDPIAVAQIQPVPSAPTPPVVPMVQVIPTPAVGVILTDTQVRKMALGSWRINDTDGSVDIVFGEKGVFQTYRYFRKLNNFQFVFVPTPSSSGNWTVENGRLLARVTTSTRADRVNQAFAPAVRSISERDMILEDQMGRVRRAVKLRY